MRVSRWRHLFIVSTLGALSVLGGFGLLSMMGTSTSAHAAWNIHPAQLPEVRRLAHQVQGDAYTGHQEAQRWSHWNDGNEQQGVNALRSLQETSTELDHVLQSAWVDPQLADQAFLRVDRDAQAVQQRLPYLRAYASNREVFDRLVQPAFRLRSIRHSGVAAPVGNVKQLSQALLQNTQIVLQRARVEATAQQPWKQSALQEVRGLVAESQALYRYLGTRFDTRQALLRVQALNQIFARTQTALNQAQFSPRVLQSLAQVRQTITELQRSLWSASSVVVAPGGGPSWPVPHAF